MRSDKEETPEDEFNRIIDCIELRAMANDGPVTPTLQEASEQELSRLWELVNEISGKRKALSRKVLKGICTDEEVNEYLRNAGLDPNQVAREGSVFVTTVTDKLRLEKMLQTFPKTKFPRESNDDHTFSEDVIIFGEDLLNIGYYSFNDQRWQFHTDTLIDMDDVDFIWMYPPDTMKPNNENTKV